jgi:molecular chaperone GrpE
MSKKNKKNQNEEAQAPQQEAQPDENQNNKQQSAENKATDNEAAQLTPEQRIAQLEEQIEHEKKEYLFLLSDFENFRRRTIMEKADLIKNGTESAMRDLLPVVDDLERAMDAMEKTEDINAVREGVKLIYQKFVRFLDEQDVHAIETEGATFDTDVHEAVTTIAAGEDKKDKVIDCTKKGYKMGDRVIRFAQVVVGA